MSPVFRYMSVVLVLWFFKACPTIHGHTQLEQRVRTLEHRMARLMESMEQMGDRVTQVIQSLEQVRNEQIKIDERLSVLEKQFNGAVLKGPKGSQGIPGPPGFPGGLNSDKGDIAISYMR